MDKGGGFRRRREDTWKGEGGKREAEIRRKRPGAEERTPAKE